MKHFFPFILLFQILASFVVGCDTEDHIDNLPDGPEDRPNIEPGNQDDNGTSPSDTTTINHPAIGVDQPGFNAFGIDGTRWNVVITSDYSAEPEIHHVTYSLEGRATVAGRDCLQYLYDGHLLYYVYTEGDKVYCIRPNNPEESLLVYDFGIKEGETVTLDIVSQYFNDKFDPHSYQQCTQISQIESCGHTYELMKMVELGEGDDPGYWLKGIGGTSMFACDFANWGYSLIGVGSVLASVEVNGETIYRRNHD